MDETIWEEKLRVSVHNLDWSSIRNLLEDHYLDQFKEQKSCSLLVDLLTSPGRDQLRCFSARRHLVYMLSNAGVNINAKDQNGRTALHYTVTEYRGDIELLEPLLQCGGDLFITDKEGHSPYSLIFTGKYTEDNVEAFVKKYSPGLFQAVHNDDLMAVRRLINQWCRVDIIKNGSTLLEKALDNGTENMIRLIKEIQPSMKLAHSVLAGDINRTRSLLTSKGVNVEFRNMGDMGATPLFYAIWHNNLELVKLLLNNRARVTSNITLGEEDIPIYFTALNRETDVDIIKSLTPSVQKNDGLQKLRYRGKNIVFHCIENQLDVKAVHHILEHAPPHLIAARNELDETILDVCKKLCLSAYVSVINQVVHEKVLISEGTYRKILAQLGYQNMEDASKHGISVAEIVREMEVASEQVRFFRSLHVYQQQVTDLAQSVSEGDLSKIKMFLQYAGPDADCYNCQLSNALPKGDGQPLLIRAVLQGHREVVEYLSEGIAAVQGIKLDNVQDQYCRTALHYAAAMPDCKAVYSILSEYGCSDYQLDKNGQSPQVFKDFRGYASMEKLLNRAKNKVWSSPEPEPWKERRAPIHIEDSVHHHSCNTEGCNVGRSRLPPNQYTTDLVNRQCNIL